MTNDLPIAVLISGGGRTLKNLLDLQQADELPIDVRLVISSCPQAGGLGFANEHSIPTLVVEQEHHDPQSFQTTIFDACRAADVKLVVMGGFMKHVLIPADFRNKVLNIHPSLIPSFSGKGFYGKRVHKAVLEYGAKVSGCSVHFVDDQYDHGPIILQRPVEVLSTDTPDTLAERVFGQECRAYPAALQLIAEGRVNVDGRRVIIS